MVAQQEQETITIKRMYQVATTAQRERKGKGPALVNMIKEEETFEEDEADDVAAFNQRGPDTKQTKLMDQTKDQDEEEVTEPETTATGMASTAISAKPKGTDKKSVKIE